VTRTDHYEPSDLAGRVSAALRQAGLENGVVRWSDTAPFDQFHVRGVASTEELAAALDPAAGAMVLDVGCGLGGPARYLAAEYGCRVTGIDLSRVFVDVAQMLIGRAGLSASVTCEQGDALDLPFADGAFDHAWTQHVAMNIRDRDRLYAGIRRVLRPLGRLGIYDIVEGNGRPLTFPVPWARDPSDSFLVSGDRMRELLAAAGFAEISWADTTDAGIAWFAEQQAGRPPPPDNRANCSVCSWSWATDFSRWRRTSRRTSRAGAPGSFGPSCSERRDVVKHGGLSGPESEP
jgi:SAM-dependent methyltransferase